eukprot:NODE_88_length_21932_cov_0.317867.p17 type:complete len:111 gc:universal NODE_88_length_21932_cov_0.317867:2857-3189(+)
MSNIKKSLADAEHPLPIIHFLVSQNFEPGAKEDSRIKELVYLQKRSCSSHIFSLYDIFSIVCHLPSLFFCHLVISVSVVVSSSVPVIFHSISEILPFNISVATSCTSFDS